ncbi:hypothetical protein B484DRAFT_178253 [Ochromonadaceae sp. CCMP2298]|nr:hypothetical protein B484DRAFT_178253 [Ochromonadaceae sp. CCMP2298]
MDSMFAFSLHELTACVYYKLAVERGVRGCNPDAEWVAHRPTPTQTHTPTRTPTQTPTHTHMHTVPTQTSNCGGGCGGGGGGSSSGSSSGSGGGVADSGAEAEYECKDAADSDLDLAIRLAPLALNIIYEENPVDCQRLARLQGTNILILLI